MVLEANDRRLLKKYPHSVRKVLDPNDTLDQLLVLHGPKPVTNANSMLQALSKQYGIYIPSSTDLRKAGSTSAWKNLPLGMGGECTIAYLRAMLKDTVFRPVL